MVNYIILGILALICVLPFWYIICLSFSSNGAVMAGKVRLLPVEFNVEAYHFTGKGRQIRIYDDVNVRFILEDMFCKLRLNYGDQKITKKYRINFYGNILRKSCELLAPHRRAIV